MSTKKSVFDTLSAINVNDKVEKKKNLSYLSWAWAWGIVKKEYPTATYKEVEDSRTGMPFFYDPVLGYLVRTTVTIEGETLPMWLPVMNGANKAMKAEPYTYSTSYGEKTVESATMFDVNSALMRCLTKNLAMFGLGHYIYAGEDLPEGEEPASIKAAPAKAAPKTKAKFTPATESFAVTAAPTPTHIALELKTDNWVKALKWVIANKAKGMDEIVKILGQKYTMSDAVKAEIKKKL